MANLNQVCGANILGHWASGPFNGMVLPFAVPATDGVAIFPGDIVKKAANFTAIDGVYYPTIAQAAATNTPIGIVVSVKPDLSNLTLLYRPASTARIIYVNVDPAVKFEMQCSGTAASTDALKKADIVVGAGNTLYGQSGMQINQTTIGSGTTIVIVSVSTEPGNNEIGAYTKYICKFAKHELPVV